MKEKLNILVVDDEAVSRTKLQSLLHGQGYERVKTEEDGKIALTHFEKSVTPDLVFLDITLPNLDGPGFIKVLNSRGHEPYIIMVSATTILENREEAASFGAMDFIAKPFNAHKINDAMGHFHRVLERLQGDLDPPSSFRY